jgi:hypothetical protein
VYSIVSIRYICVLFYKGIFGRFLIKETILQKKSDYHDEKGHYLHMAVDAQVSKLRLKQP